METKSQLRKLVKLFTTFKIHLSVFAIANGVLWLIWLMTEKTTIYSWPVYLSLIWLVVLTGHYVVAYKKFSKKTDKI